MVIFHSYVTVYQRVTSGIVCQKSIEKQTKEENRRLDQLVRTPANRGMMGMVFAKSVPHRQAAKHG